MEKILIFEANSLAAQKAAEKINGQLDKDFRISYTETVGTSYVVVLKKCTCTKKKCKCCCC